MNNLADLTMPQLEQGSADLKNAALVVEYAGHAKQTLVDLADGSVCAAGAIDLATFRRLAYIDNPIRQWLVLDNFLDHDHFRAESAYAIFADFLPDELCSECDYTKTCDCSGVPHQHDAPTPWERIVHYNDTHCTGGALLANMLRLGAERAELEMYDRRRMLTGAVLTA